MFSVISPAAIFWSQTDSLKWAEGGGGWPREMKVDILNVNLVIDPGGNSIALKRRLWSSMLDLTSFLLMV